MRGRPEEREMDGLVRRKRRGEREEHEVEGVTERGTGREGVFL